MDNGDIGLYIGADLDFKTILTSNIKKVICVECRNEKETTIVNCFDRCFPKKDERKNYFNEF